MPEPRVRQNYLAIVIAAIACFVFDATWYTLFLQPWLRGVSRTIPDLKATGVSEYWSYGIALVMTMVMAAAISCITQLTGAQTAARGIRVGILLSLAFVVTTFATEYAFEWRPQLFAINAGYSLISMTLMGAIVGGWKKKAPAGARNPEDRAAMAAK
jgi:hypothetical protein